jgi:hypothetical protein
MHADDEEFQLPGVGPSTILASSGSRNQLRRVSSFKIVGYGENSKWENFCALIND